VFHFGPNAGLDLLQLVDQGVYSFALLQSPALTRHHGNLHQSTLAFAGVIQSFPRFSTGEILNLSISIVTELTQINCIVLYPVSAD
jgi:hypothetical protein